MKMKVLLLLISLMAFNTGLSQNSDITTNLYETYENRETWISWLNDGRFDFIRHDPRFVDLYEKAGFNTYEAYRKKQRESQKSS